VSKRGSGDEVTEAELAAVTVGPVQRLTERIVRADPDLAWPAWFEREATRVDMARRGRHTPNHA
jgi:hypothetical protein